MTDLEHIEALAKAATPGPWHDDGQCVVQVRQDGKPSLRVYLPDGKSFYCLDNPVLGGPSTQHADGEYIAALDPDTALALVAHCRAAEARVNPDARPCYYCGEMCEPLSANPSRWPVTLCHPDEPGRPKQHHVGCVSERLERAVKAEARVAELEAELLDQAYEQENYAP